MVNQNNLTDLEKLSVAYHNIFDYPLDLADLIKWTPLDKKNRYKKNYRVVTDKGFFYLEDRDGLIYKRLLRKRVSVKKLKIARSVSKILGYIPCVLMVGVTGSLAMENSSSDSDIDFIFITKKGTLWFTRLISYFLLIFMGYLLRRPRDRDQKDKLCLNMWLDESDLVWARNKRNIYTAHEIAQVVPLVNKKRSYENFIYQNKWILDFWPNAVRVSSKKLVVGSKQKKSWLLATFYTILSFVEKLTFKLQYKYMKSKITREVVTPTRAIFHPEDWGEVVLNRLTT